MLVSWLTPTIHTENKYMKGVGQSTESNSSNINNYFIWRSYIYFILWDD